MFIESAVRQNEHLESLYGACGLNIRRFSRALSGVSRCLVFGRMMQSTEIPLSKGVNQDAFKAAFEYHERGFEESGITFEILTAALVALSECCKNNQSAHSERFYIRWAGKQIHCSRRHSDARGAGNPVPLANTLLRAIFDFPSAEAFVSNVLVDDIRAHYDLLHRDVDVLSGFRRLSASYNRFWKKHGRVVEFPTLRNTLCQEVGLPGSFVDAFIEWLLLRGVIRQDRYRSTSLYHVGPVDASFIRNTLLGLYSGVSGLDYLFEGALLTNHASPVTMVINGDKGTGKSSMALTYGSAWAAAGGLVGYAAMEEDIGTLSKVLLDWGTSDLGAFDLLTSEAGPGQVEDCRKRGKGVFLLGKPGQALTFGMLRQKLEDAVHRRLWKQFPLRLIIVDPINAIRNYGDDETWRTDLADFLEVLRGQGFSVILLTELGASDRPNFEAYLADTVINLSYQQYHSSRSDVLMYDYHALEIKKSRQQHTCRGQHLYRLRAGKGFRVYPSSGAILATVKKPKRVHGKGPQPKPATLSMPTTVFSGFDKLSKTPGAQWLRAQTCTAIVGEPGTHKSELARIFSKSALLVSQGPNKHRRVDAGGGKASIVILFGQRLDVSREVHVEELFGLVDHCRCFEVYSKKVGNYINQSRELVLEIPSGYQTASHILADIVDCVEYLRGRNCQPRCAILDDLDSMQTQQPVLAADEFFLPCLVQYLESCQASVFLVSRHPEGESGERHRKVESLADNVIRLLHIYEPGRDRTAIYISKSLAGQHNTDVFELTFNATTSGFEIRDSFWLYRNLRHGEKTSRVGLRLIFSAETALQKEYYRQFQSVHKWVDTGVTVHTVSPVFDLHRKLLSRQLTPTSGDVVVVACDNPDLPELIDAGCFENLYRLLDDDCVQKVFGGGFTRDSLFDKENPFLRSIMGRSLAPNHAHYQLPYYANMAVLVSSSQFKRKVRERKGASYTWRDLYELASTEAQTKGCSVRIFDCQARQPQTYFCLFLEIMFSLLNDRLSDEEKVALYHPRNGQCMEFCNCLSKYPEEARETISLIYELTRVISPAHEMDGHIETVEPIFSRHWFTTFRQEMADCLRNRREVDVEVMPLPYHISVIGDWHLCVLSGSSAPRLGAQCIVDLCSDEMAVERQAHGIGLPVTRKFYEGNYELPFSMMAMKEYERIHDRGISRTAIQCYRSVSLLIGHCISAFLQRPQEIARDGEVQMNFIRSLAGLFSQAQCPAKRR